MSRLIGDYYDRTDYSNGGQWLLAMSSLAALICVLHIRMCSKVPLVGLGLTLSIDNTWPLPVSDHPQMFINAGVNTKVYVFQYQR